MRFPDDDSPRGWLSLVVHLRFRVLAASSIFLLFCSLIAGAAPRPVIPLWPGVAPGDQGDLPAEADTTKPTDNLIAGKRLIRLGNVSTPTITVYRPSKSRHTGAAVLVAPGGGYHILAMDLEGTEVCEWLNSIGVTGVLLKYRVPRRADRPRYEAPLQDAQRAFSLIQQHAAEWGIDPQRVGVLGFSAGAHLSAALSTTPGRIYPRVDAADDSSLRPAFTVLIYPGGLTVREQGDRIAPELNITSNAPPAFITMAQDDNVRVENALHYALGLKQANVPVELHIYPSGGHGYGLRRTANPVTWWPDRARDWMKHQGWLERKK